MIYKGKVLRIGGGANMTQHRYGMVDALEIEGYPELREVKGTTYLLDHLRSAMDLGETVVVGLHGTTMVALKRNGKMYSDVNFQGVINSQGVLKSSLMGMGCLFYIVPGVLIYWYFRRQLQQVVQEVETAT